MWQVVNHTPFEAAGAFERNARGREAWVVAIRGKFRLAAGGLPLPIANTQDPVRQEPIYTGKDDAALAGESDIAGFITGTDVLINGTIRAPEWRSPHVDLALRIGKTAKHARLFGAREAKRQGVGWALAGAEPVADTALTWEASFGGALPGSDIFHPANPVGAGLALAHPERAAKTARVVLPRIEGAAGDLLRAPGRAQPVGFGAIARHWQPRAGFGGTFDAAWEKTRAPILPADFDPRFYNSASADQTVAGHLKGGEPIELVGFFPEGPVDFRLPQVIFTARTRFRGQRIESRFALARVEIDLDSARLSMVWTTHVDCNGDDAGIEKTTLRVKQMAGVAR